MVIVLPVIDAGALRKLRESRQLSQDALAKKVGVSQPYIAMLEAGVKKSPSLRILRRLAEALDVRATELVVSSRRKRAMPPTSEEFEAELLQMIADASRRGASYIDIESGDLHRRVGGYPSDDHRMPICCAVMRRQLRPGDEILAEPPKGQGATLRIRYRLPREAESTLVPLRDLVIVFLRTDERESMLSGLTPAERRAILYQYSTVPNLGAVDANQIPEPPFSDREMNRLVVSGLRKIEKWLGVETQKGVKR